MFLSDLASQLLTYIFLFGGSGSETLLGRHRQVEHLVLRRNGNTRHNVVVIVVGGSGRENQRPERTTK